MKCRACGKLITKGVYMDMGMERVPDVENGRVVYREQHSYLHRACYNREVSVNKRLGKSVNKAIKKTMG